MLESRVEEWGERPFFRFLVEGELDGIQEELSFAALAGAARAIAARLTSEAARERPVLILVPPGPHFLKAFFGCLYAGAIAVPMYPPDPARLQRSIERLQAIVNHCRSGLLLTTKEWSPMLAGAAHASGLRMVTLDAVDEAPAFAPHPSEVAMYQYTSGSTASPKGVVLKHSQLLINVAQIEHAFNLSAGLRIVSWLPPYHDMGLIGALLHPIYQGIEITALSPHHFLQDPLRWLRTISGLRAQVSGGPNFAYDLVCRRVTEAQKANLDLSCWTIASNGAEPVRAETLAAFARTFASCGFDPRAFRPCYGLAEGTLLVSVRSPAHSLEPLAVDAVELERGAVAPPVPGQPTRELVSSGVPARDIEVAIVDVVSAERLGDRRVGEIWVRGPNVASGYFADPEQTQDTFGGVLGDGEPWLRTGDLGATLDGQLFVTGRLKDLIIVRGRNLYPQDVERTVERACSLVRPGGVVAFSGLNEGLYIIAEVRDPVDGQGTRQSAPFESALDQLVRAVVEEHELAPTRIVLVPARSVRKTSSGKLARRATRADFEQGALQVLAQYPASNLAQCSSPYRQLEHVFRRLDARHTRYQFDLELDVPWAQLDAPGDYYGPEALRGYGYDVDALRANAGAWRLFQWRTALSIATGFEELERALISFTRRESAHFSGVKSVPVLEQEEIKHVALFKRYAEHLAAQRPEHAAHVTEKGSELRRELEAFAHPEIFPSVAAYHYSWWLVILFFEELTIWLYEVLAAEQGIQPAWLAAHRLHAREEAQHVLTDFAFLQSIEASDEERLAWSEQVFQRVAPRLALAMSPEAGLELTLAAYPDLGVRQIRRNPGSPFAALLRNSSFSRTCAAGPYFARVARGDAHPTQDAKPLPSSEDARDLEAWILRWVTENVSLPAGGARVDDVHRDLQAVGLDSVQAVALSGALERHLECRMPLSCVYDHPTAARLARFALARASAGVTAVQSEPEPLLARQRRLLALEVAQPGRVLDHISLLFESSTGDAESWLRALAELVQRQPQLWTQFAGPPSFEPGLCSDLGSPPRLDELPVIVVQRPFNDARLAQRLAELDRTPFILKGAPPWRAELWAQERRTALLLTMHHVCADGWSTEVLFRELDALGAAVPRAVPRIPAVLAAPGLAREQSLLRSAEAVRRLEFARALLKGHPDLERPGRRTRGQVRAAGASLTATQWTMLAELARRHQASPYLVLLTVFHQAWRTHTRRDDLLIQTHLFNRVSEQERQSVAYLVNLLVLRTEIHDGMAFGAALERVRGAWLEATEQELPIDHLVRELFPERYAEPWMPARVAFNMLLPPSESGQVLTWRHELAPTPSFLFFDGMLLGRPRAQGLDLTFWYDGEAFAPEQAEGFMQSFGTRLRSLLEAGVSTQSPARPPEVP